MQPLNGWSADGSSKFQDSKLQRNPKLQIPKPRALRSLSCVNPAWVPIGFWDFGLLSSSDLGVWRLDGRMGLAFGTFKEGAGRATRPSSKAARKDRRTRPRTNSSRPRACVGD